MPPSQVEAARRAAYGFASEKLIAEQSAVSLPVPSPGPSGPALAFLLCYFDADPDGGDYRLYEPILTVTVDSGSLTPVAHEWCIQGEVPSRRAPLCSSLPPAARALPHPHLAALSAELQLLYDQVLPLVGRVDLSTQERAFAVRFGLLFHFLVPQEMLPYYRRLNPDFFVWLSRTAGSDEHHSNGPPQPKSGLRAPSRTLLERFDALALARAVPPSNTWRVKGPTLRAVIHKLRVTPTAHSPLAALVGTAAADSGRPEAPVRGWPGVEWEGAVKTLCEPDWELSQVYGDADRHVRARYYGKRNLEEVNWVGHFFDGEAHVLSFPVRLAQLGYQAIAALGASAISRADIEAGAFSPTELSAVAALADLQAQGGPGRSTVTLEELRRAWRAGRPDGSLRWSFLVRLLSPAPSAPSEDVIRVGVGEFLFRGLMRGSRVRPEAEPPLHRLQQRLGQPIAYYALAVHARDGQGGVRTSGFSAIRTGQHLWVWELAGNRNLGQPPSEGRIQTFAVTTDQFLALLKASLGGEPVPRPPRAPRFCEKCGAPARGGARFCSECGGQLTRP